MLRHMIIDRAILFKIHTLLFEHVTQSQYPRMREILMFGIKCQFVNVSLKSLKQSPQFIIHLSSLCLNIGAKQSVVDIEDNAM